MKNLLLLLALILPMISFGTILTLDNSSSSPGQYTNIYAAYTAASAGDTILVRGSLLNYGSIDIKKKIIIIGSGYNPSPSDIYPTTFNNIRFLKSYNYDGSGSKVMGVKIKSGYALQMQGSLSYGSVSDITIERCYGKISTTHASGMKLINNIIILLSINSYTHGNSVVYNNIILNLSFSTTYNSNSLTFDHNIFTNGSFINFRYCIVKNSIFYNSSPANTAITNTSFSNNIAYGSTNDTFNISTNSNVGYNNMNHTDPNFVSSTPTNFDFYHDYHLQNGSPGISAATDGSNIGIYGGLYPFPIGGASGSGFQTSQEPAIPQIYNYIIQNQTVQPNDSVSVNIKVSIQK